MSEYLGARISLISKSDIRYSGVLHQINSEESTVSLENVKSYGTEGRKGNPDEEIPPADQVYEYIVFRGSDVKDLRIEEGPFVKENKPPVMPNDPAIVGARPRQANAPGPSFQPGPPGPPGPLGPLGPLPPSMQMPPAHPAWAVGGPPPPRPFGYPPPGWFPPGQAFPPSGPPMPWGSGFYGPGPSGPPGFLGNTQPAPQTPENKPAPIGAGVDKQKAPQAPVPATETTSAAQAPIQTTAVSSTTATVATASVSMPISAPAAAPVGAPAPPVDSKPSAEEVKASAASVSTNNQTNPTAEAGRAVPTGPRMTRITPAVPLPAALTNKAASQMSGPDFKDRGLVDNAAALRDATQAARAAVAVAMAKLESGAAGSVQTQHQGNGGASAAMDNLTKKVHEMRVNAARSGPSAAPRGGRGRGGRSAKVEVPDTDFDFASSNAKFNKEEVVKEAIAGSPLADTPNGSVGGDAQDAASSNHPPAYNKSMSFFDNISSEAKDRAENGGQKPGGREWRGEEQRKNMETFGQGSVDGGFRGYRNRGGRGRGRGYGRGGRGGYRRNNNGSSGVPE